MSIENTTERLKYLNRKLISENLLLPENNMIQSVMDVQEHMDTANESLDQLNHNVQELFEKQVHQVLYTSLTTEQYDLIKDIDFSLRSKTFNMSFTYALIKQSMIAIFEENYDKKLYSVSPYKLQQLFGRYITVDINSALICNEMNITNKHFHKLVNKYFIDESDYSARSLQREVDKYSKSWAHKLFYGEEIKELNRMITIEQERIDNAKYLLDFSEELLADFHMRVNEIVDAIKKGLEQKTGHTFNIQIGESENEY